MKRDKKYYKEIPKGTLMNGLRHIVFILIIGFAYADVCEEVNACNTGSEGPCEYAEEGLTCDGTPIGLVYNQSTLQAFYYFDSVTIDGVALESNDWVGAFKGDVCVGARLWDTSSCGNGVCDITVMGDDGWPESSGYIQPGDIPTFKIYDTSNNNYYDAQPSGVINTNGGECGGVVPECMEWSINNLYTIDNLNVAPDCAGDLGGIAYIDNCGTCDSDLSNDCVGEYDSCGILNGNDSDCWYIDIEAVVSEETSGATIAQDIENRIGMHSAAEDTLNVDTDPTYDCDYCYMDVYEPPDGDNDPDHETKFYFPHPEWNYFLGEDFTQDIRALNTLQNFEDVKVWDAVFKSDFSQSNVTLTFTMINEMILRGAGGFVRVFVLQNNIYTEINNGDDYTFSHWDSDDSLKIVIGMGDSPPRVTVISPNGNEIRSTEDSLIVKLEYEVYEFIDSLKLDLQIMECTDTAYTTKEACELVGNEWSAVSSFTVFDGPPVDEFSISSLIIENFYNANSNDSDDYLSRVSIHAEIIDLAGGDVSIFPDYQDDSDNTFTISKPESTTEFATGWHLLSPPLGGLHDLENIFANLSYDCADGCNIIETANSGTGFYVRSYGENSEFTFNGEVLSEFSTTLEQGWNLTGNPLINSVDINSVIITYNNTDYNWPDAAEFGIISPKPIIYDNDLGSHVGTESLSTAQGFWIHSFFNDVEISFIPSNPSPEIEPSLYWNLSLFVKEYEAMDNFDKSIGSEIVIGIHEDANDTFVDGEDQEIFPLSEMNIFDSYTGISINNNGTSSIYQDIRSYHGTSITWDLDLEGEYIDDQEVTFSWEFSGDKEPYDYYLTIGGNIVDMKGQTSAVVSSINFSEDISITAVLKDEYIGCTNPDAADYDADASNCTGGTCLGGNDADFCEIISLLLPATEEIVENGDIELPISMVNPGEMSIEGLQFVLEYDAEMIQLNEVILNEDVVVEDYEMVQEFCTDCIPAELSVSIYFMGLIEEFNDCGVLNGVTICAGEDNWEDSLGNGKWDVGEEFIDMNDNNEYDDESFNGEGEILTLSGIGLGIGSTTISFSSVQINEYGASGNSCDIEIGITYLTVSGKLNYYKNVVPVSLGSISIKGPDLDFSTTSNESGNFTIDSLISSPINSPIKTYELIISKDEYEENIDDYFDGLSAVDASRIYRHSVGLYNFSTNEKIAANVIIDYRCEDGDGNPIEQNESECSYNWVPNIEAGDASKVARYAAGIIEDLDDQCDPHWIFLNPDDEIMIHDANCNDLPNFSKFVRSYKIVGLNSDTTLTFEGIRLGDVTGNWTAAGRQNEDYFVDNPMVDVELGQIVKLPLYLPNKIEIEGLDLTIQYDPEVFNLIGFNDNNSILDKSKYPTIINTEKTGLFTLVSYANSTPINDNGLLGHIKFEVIGNSTRWSSISINEMKINDIQEGGFLVEGNFESSSIAYGFDFQISAVPEVFALNKNYPNPFNPSTNIKFELPDDGDVQIFIYDLKGSLIDELVNGYMEAGYHNLKWDASHKASGVYFIQMIADNGNYIKMSKMMLVK